MCYTLPKIFKGRIQKYWDKTVPTDYPDTNSTFSLTFDDDATKAAVKALEDSLSSETSIVYQKIPQGNYLESYVGTYNVGYVGEIPAAGVNTLLSPEKVDEHATVTVLHYTNNAWESVTDAAVVNGYVYGTVTEFSPFAVFTSAKEVHKVTTVPGIVKENINFIICEGNTVKIYKDTDEKYVVENSSTGKKIEITAGDYIIGGSIDGSYIKETSISVTGIPANIIDKIYGGSVYTGSGNDFVSIENINVIIADSNIRLVTGAMGAAKVDNVNMQFTNTTLSAVGCGEGYAGLCTPPVTIASRSVVKNSVMTFDNCTVTILYAAQNNEYCYIEDAKVYINGGVAEYLTSGGSNDGTVSAYIEATDATIGMYQTTNRGNVVLSNIKLTNCTVTSLYVGGDPTDSTVNGTTEKIRVDICSGGTYNILKGTEAGAAITTSDNVDAVKISRNATYTVNDELAAILGNKLIIK